MTSKILVRVVQGLGVAVVAAGLSLGASPLASAEAAWDLEQYDDCIISGGEQQQCCLDSGGMTVEGDAQKCVAPPASSDHTTNPSPPRKPNVHSADVPTPGRSQSPTGSANPTVPKANVSEPGQSQPNQPTKPSVPKAGVSNPGASQPSSPSNSGLA
jgi:hypothetical protein